MAKRRCGELGPILALNASRTLLSECHIASSGSRIAGEEIGHQVLDTTRILTKGDFMKTASLPFRVTERLTWARHRNARRVVMVLLVSICCGSDVSAQEKTVTPAEALQRLKDGNLR